MFFTNNYNLLWVNIDDINTNDFSFNNFKYLYNLKKSSFKN